jgi:hypothetical protein
VTAVAKWAALEAKGCKCGTDEPGSCPIHVDLSDNRGLRAWFQAGMPNGFPVEGCRCGICGTGGCLLYPNVELDDPESDAGFRPTLVCPSCSTPAAERALRAEVEATGNYKLKPVTVFGGLAVAA